ncbi:MAG: CRISPR-associated protein [Symploca sp. SIO2G7]|nr:CRISPR-associated protein [Symploca sp. SIO2G7]
MFQHLITVSPLGLMYGSAGAFLSPKNLVGRSGTKFPPDAATLSGLFFSTNHTIKPNIATHKELTQNLYVAGPFWAPRNDPQSFYVPIPRHRIISLEKKDEDEWYLNDKQRWQRDPKKKDKDLEPDCFWQSINAWERSTRQIRTNKETKKVPWEYVSFLHPKMKNDERHVTKKDGLFLENAVQMDEDYCLVYLSTYALKEGWYRFGGEGHMVEIVSYPLPPDSIINKLLHHPDNKIQRACALITPGVWGSNKLSYRYPKHPEFPRCGLKMLTDKAVPYRYRLGNQKTERGQRGQGGQLSRGRYAVPVGTVYVFKQPLNKTWWEFPDEWFPEARTLDKEQLSPKKSLLKKVGCGLCLPIEIQGVA